MGRKPDPTHLKLVKGVTRKDRIPQHEPKVESGMPPTPPLSGPLAVRAWHALGKTLLDMGVLTPADGAALQRLAECQADVQNLTMILAGYTAPTYEADQRVNMKTFELIEGTGTKKPHPERALLSDADRRLRAYLGEFGLTPAARTKVKVVEPKSTKSTDRFFG